MVGGLGAVSPDVMTTRRLLFAAGIAVLATTGCANRYKLDAEAPTYAAQAKIKVKTNRDNNRVMSVMIDHLAPPSRVDPSYNSYVVWIRVPGVETIRAGVLDYNSRRRRGKLEATTPHSNFEVLVTLESNSSAAMPNPNNVVLSKVIGYNGIMARIRD